MERKIQKNLIDRFIASEKGATLIIAVMILVALTLIGLSLVSSTNIATNASGNLKARSQAYHAAETCLYYQIKNIKDSLIGTPALNYDLGNGLSCTATAPTTTGTILGTGGLLTGYSLEEGSESSTYIAYNFQVTGNGPRNTTSNMDVVIRISIASGS